MISCSTSDKMSCGEVTGGRGLNLDLTFRDSGLRQSQQERIPLVVAYQSAVACFDEMPKSAIFAGFT